MLGLMLVMGACLLKSAAGAVVGSSVSNSLLVGAFSSVEVTFEQSIKLVVEFAALGLVRKYAVGLRN